MPADVITSYEGLVAAGREARERVDDYQWTEGDLALQVEALTPDLQPRDDQGNYLAGESALKKYADDIEVDYNTLGRYRAVAQAWPARLRRRTVSWAVHKELAPVSDRFDHIRDGMTMREARELSRELRGLNAKASRVGPNWFELLGLIGDDLIAARKHLVAAETAIEDPSPALREKAGQYAEWAEDLAARLREISAA